MEFIKTKIDGVFLIKPRVYYDSRGFFFESFSQREFNENVFPVNFIQDNESLSKKNVVRALHFQQPPYDMCKLVHVISGKVVDVAVDVRLDSPTYGKYISVELSSDNHNMLFIPRGFAHGFVALSDEVIFQYKVDNLYHPQSEVAIKWNDVNLGIDWKIDEHDAILSENDMFQVDFKSIKSLFRYSEYKY